MSLLRAFLADVALVNMANVADALIAIQGAAHQVDAGVHVMARAGAAIVLQGHQPMEIPVQRVRRAQPEPLQLPQVRHLVRHALLGTGALRAQRVLVRTCARLVDGAALASLLPRALALATSGTGAPPAQQARPRISVLLDTSARGRVRQQRRVAVLARQGGGARPLR